MTALRRVLFAAFVLGLGLSITLSETALALLAALWLWTLRSPAGRAAARWPLLAPVLAFSAVSVLSALASGHPGPSLAAAKGLLLVAALYVTADFLHDPAAADRFLWALSLVVGVAALVGLLQAAVCPGQEADYGSPAWLYHRCYRARGFFSIYMTLAGVLNLVLLATVPRLLPGPAFRGWSVPVWLVNLAAFVATQTRGAWIGFIGGVVALLPASRRGRWLLLGGLLLLAAGALLAPYELKHRVRVMADPSEAGVTERLYMWRSGLSMWRERPWLGVGPGGVKREYPNYALPEAAKKRTGHVHNTPLQILVERGALGLAAWLWLFGAFYARAIGLLRRLPRERARERALAAGSLAAITGFLLAGLSEYNFGDTEVVLVAWTIMALPFVVEASVLPMPDRPPR
ncbi:MAG TPA: O-antigen ligase family protein [Methylomirabilota bacterium]|nr:O-antigen ligase family protein [Methylomirabilota bacterium]